MRKLMLLTTSALAMAAFGCSTLPTGELPDDERDSILSFASEPSDTSEPLEGEEELSLSSMSASAQSPENTTDFEWEAPEEGPKKERKPIKSIRAVDRQLFTGSRKNQLYVAPDAPGGAAAVTAPAESPR